MGSLYSVKYGYLRPSLMERLWGPDRRGGGVELASTGIMTPDHVLWAYRLFLDREPEDLQYIERFRNYPDTKALRKEFLASPEYALKNGGGGSIPDLKVIADLSPYGFEGRLWVNLSDYIGLSVAKAQYEPEEVAFFKTNIKPGHTVVDIGGNIGFFTVLASHLVGSSGRVFTYEPVPSTLEYLTKSIKENPFCANVTVTQAIVADKDSDGIEIAYMPLEEGSGSTGGSYIVNKGDSIPAHLHRQAIIAKKLDTLIQSDVLVDFIKIDIEGAEPLAMQGAERILTTQSPIILSEVHTDQLKLVSKTDWRGYFDLMQSYGYKPRFFEGGQLAGVPSVLEGGKVYNVAFIKV